jgi:type I restriction enzyme S subunit
VESLVRGSTRARINLSVASQILVPRPPLIEQDAISEFVSEQTVAIGAIASRSESQINLLREYRSALITAAVTGQLDIREHEKKMEALA